MGSIVVEDVKDDWIVYGNPAREIRMNKRGKKHEIS